MHALYRHRLQQEAGCPQHCRVWGVCGCLQVDLDALRVLKPPPFFRASQLHELLRGPALHHVALAAPLCAGGLRGEAEPKPGIQEASASRKVQLRLLAQPTTQLGPTRPNHRTRLAQRPPDSQTD